jgi:NAD+ kinase
VLSLLPELSTWLRERVDEVGVEEDVRAFCRTREETGGGAPPPDLLVVLGGDGAILAAVRAFSRTPVPTIGIHFGRVGFLASVEAEHWCAALEEILSGRAVCEPRLRLVASFPENGRPESEPARPVALNDMVLSRGAYQGMLQVALRVDSDWLTNYRADGLIVATASGSTAHSLAAGGPILAPSMEGLVVTPICAQGLSHRPIVLHPDSVLELSVAQSAGVTTLSVDGQGYYPLRQGDTVTLRRHPTPYPLLSLSDLDPYKRLRDRLGWRGSAEPDVFPAHPSAPAPDCDTGEGGCL